MYVAFRWLTALACAMWLGLCCLDMYLMEYKTSISLRTTYKEILKLNNVSTTLKDKKIKNITSNWNKRHNFKHPGAPFQHYVMFLAGALAVLIYNKKNTLIVYWKNNAEKIIQSLKTYYTALNFKIAALVGVTIYYWSILREIAIHYISKSEQEQDNVQNPNSLLLKRIKDLAEERNALGQLLTAAIQENKIIRRQYKLEAITKNRILRQVQNTQNLIRENNSRYVDFQQLYLATEKENSCLRESVKKLRDEKDNAEKNLMELINAVYQSKNNGLKAYCARFIVTERNLLNSDVNKEIRKFWQSSNPLITELEAEDISIDVSNGPLKSRITEILEDDSFSSVSLISNGPKLRGLPGEYVWTVKDKNGIIEKLYEYNYEEDYDNGDTIRRIRQYSVYHDKDCLLDHTSLATNTPTCPSLSASATRIRLDIKSLSSQGLLAKFLLKNNPLRLPPLVETLPLSYRTSDF